MKKLFKDWTLFEIILLIISFILIIVSGVICRSEVLTICASVSGVLCALLQAKGKVISQFVGLIEAVLYSIVSFKNQFYGEVIIYVTIMAPLYIMGIISWIRNKNEETNTVNKNTILLKEWIILTIVNIIVFIGLYYILKYFNTSQLFVSTLSMTTSLTATYLIARRSKYSFVFYILNDVILLLLWGLPIIKGDFTLIPMIISPTILLTEDIYGWKNWNKE